MKRRRRSAREVLEELKRVEGAFTPDRVVALLWVAISVGIWTLWIASVLKWDSALWFSTSQSALHWYGFALSWNLYGVWVCVAVWQGRRWAFVALAFHSANALTFPLFGTFTVDSIIDVATLLYCVLRLTSFLGPPLPCLKPRGLAYTPDRWAGISFAVLNTGFLLRNLFWPLPGQPPLDYRNYIYMAVSMAELYWANYSLFKGRGWTIGVGLFFSTIGYFAVQGEPDVRVQTTLAAVSLIYFAARLAWLGPRPKGIFGMTSE